jgi:hypothetical protein
LISGETVFAARLLLGLAVGVPANCRLKQQTTKNSRQIFLQFMGFPFELAGVEDRRKTGAIVLQPKLKGTGRWSGSPTQVSLHPNAKAQNRLGKLGRLNYGSLRGLQPSGFATRRLLQSTLCSNDFAYREFNAKQGY